MRLLNGTFGHTNTTISLNVSILLYSDYAISIDFLSDEETGKCLDQWSVLIYRRWNYENNIAAVVCHVDNTGGDTTSLSADVFRESVSYTLQKLDQGHENDSTSIYDLKIFYPLNKNVCIEEFLAILENLKELFCLVFTIVPVIGLKSEQTYLSMSGIRNQ